MGAWRRSFSTSSAVQNGNDELVKIGFVGAGGVSFGTKEGPWNHSVRLERMPNVQFTAIVDPNLELAKVKLFIYVFKRHQSCNEAKLR